jgi:hypothetical protein
VGAAVHHKSITIRPALAHNVPVWAWHWPAPHEPKVRRYGIMRMRARTPPPLPPTG